MARTLVGGRGERPPRHQKQESTVTIKNFLAKDQACYARRGTYGCGISIEDLHCASTDPRSILFHQEITPVPPSMVELACFRIAICGCTPVSPQSLVAPSRQVLKKFSMLHHKSMRQRHINAKIAGRTNPFDRSPPTPSTNPS
jgi:hypothetical protein